MPRKKPFIRDLLFTVIIMATGFCCTGCFTAVTLDELGEAVIAMASVNRTEHVVSVQADRNTSYEAYFKLQNTIVGAYQTLREQYAQQHYGKHYLRCNSEERQMINEYYPLRISESPIEEGGRP